MAVKSKLTITPDEEYSSISSEGDIGIINLEDCSSLCNYNLSEESETVNISVPFPMVNGKPRSVFVGETISTSITIKNITSEFLELWLVKFYDSKPPNSFTLSMMEPPTAKSDAEYVEKFWEGFSLEEKYIKLDRDLKLWLSCKPKETGLHVAAIHFKVGDETIERLVFLMAEDKKSRSLSTTRPYQNKKKGTINEDAVHVVGQRPSKGCSGGREFWRRKENYPTGGSTGPTWSHNVEL